MVKGATKRIVEIKETGSQYFERAIFFVNMDYHHHTTENALDKEARRIIECYANEKYPTKTHQTSRKTEILFSIIKLVGSAAFGAFLTLLFTEIL